MANTLRLAQQLGAFLGRLEDLACRVGDEYHDEAPMAASYLALLNRLADIGSPPYDEETAGAVEAAVGAAFEVWCLESGRARQADQARRDRRQAEYDEAVRRHEAAITAECPYCGAAPGTTCRTAGPSGKRQPKGVHDHRGRYRAARALLDSAEGVVP